MSTAACANTDKDFVYDIEEAIMIASNQANPYSSPLVNSSQNQTNIQPLQALPRRTLSNVNGISTILGDISSFIYKLSVMINSGQYSHFICWTDNGETICISTDQANSDDVLPKFYKSKRLSSFVRQLNIYEFQKNTDFIDPQDKFLYFQHKFFKRNHPELLKLIKRKPEKHNSEHKNNSQSNHSETSKSSMKTLSSKCTSTTPPCLDCHHLASMVVKLSNENELVNKNIRSISKEYKKLSQQIDLLKNSLTLHTSFLSAIMGQFIKFCDDKGVSSNIFSHSFNQIQLMNANNGNLCNLTNQNSSSNSHENIQHTTQQTPMNPMPTINDNLIMNNSNSQLVLSSIFDNAMHNAPSSVQNTSPTITSSEPINKLTNPEHENIINPNAYPSQLNLITNDNRQANDKEFNVESLLGLSNNNDTLYAPQTKRMKNDSDLEDFDYLISDSNNSLQPNNPGMQGLFEDLMQTQKQINEV